MTLFAKAAAHYIRLGWKVLALGEGSKIPVVKGGHGFKDATTDVEVIDRLARRFPRANIGIATGAISGITVVDVDPRNGGNASVAALAAEGLMFPRGPEVCTGNNGRHLFFAYRPEVRGSSNKLGAGIDVKADGGYVVAAPSVIAPSSQGPGGVYRWLVAPTELELPRLPTWLVTKFKPPKAPQFERAVRTSTEAALSLERLSQRVASAAVGERNNMLNWAAYQAGILVQQGRLSPAIVTSRLTQAALSAGLDLRATHSTIRSGLKGARRGP